MPELSDIAAADCDQVFADWGEPATLEHVVEFYDPLTGIRTESVTATPIQVVSGHRMQTRSSETIAPHVNVTNTFLVRPSEVPPGHPWFTSRLVIGQTSYRVIAVTASPLLETLMVEVGPL